MSRQLFEIFVPRTARVFVLDDDGERVLWFKKRLPNAVFSPSCTQSKQALSQSRFDFLFFDYNLAGGTGGDVARYVATLPWIHKARVYVHSLDEVGAQIICGHVTHSVVAPFGFFEISLVDA